jgi:hypothetical protein
MHQRFSTAENKTEEKNCKLKHRSFETEEKNKKN